jgi:hypothetical protein
MTATGVVGAWPLRASPDSADVDELLFVPVVANSPSFYAERVAFERALPARVKSANPRFPD